MVRARGVRGVNYFYFCAGRTGVLPDFACCFFFSRYLLDSERVARLCFLRCKRGSFGLQKGLF